jgi:nitrogen regulatory protein PII
VQVDEFVEIIANSGRTGSTGAGWIYVMDVQSARAIA